jgi:hypothetical protein
MSITPYHTHICHQTLALGVLTNMVMPSSCVQSFIEHGLLLG